MIPLIPVLRLRHLKSANSKARPACLKDQSEWRKGRSFSFVPARALRSQSGITLVELLVTLAIVTVLVALLVPVFFVARNKSNQTVCLNNLKQLGHSIDLYTADWDGLYPEAPGSANADSVSASMLTGMASFDEIRRLKPSQGTYLRMQLTAQDRSLKDQIFHCPNDGARPDSGIEAFGYKQGSVYEYALTSYLWDPANPLNVRQALAESPNIDPDDYVNGRSTGEIQDPSQARLLQDYGVRWHTTRASQPGQPSVWQGNFNVVFADYRVKLVKGSAQSQFTSYEPLNATPPGP